MTISDFDGAQFWPGIKQFVIDAGVEPISVGEPEDEIWRKIFQAAAAAGSPLSLGMSPPELMRAAFALSKGAGVPPFVQPVYPTENAVTLADMRRVANISGGGSLAGLSDVTAGGFPIFGTDGVQLVTSGSDKVVGPVAALASPVNCSAPGGFIRIWFRPISGGTTLSRFVLELSANSIGDVSNFVRCSQFNTSADVILRLTAKDNATAGRWQGYSIPIASFTELAGTATLADLASVRVARLRLRSSGAAVEEGFVIEYVPPKRTKAACLFGFDDGKLSHLSYVAPKLAQYGWAGIAYPSPASLVGTDPNVMTVANLKTLQDTYGWQIAAQAWLDEDGARFDALTTAQQKAELANIDTWQQANGLRGYPSGSGFSNVQHNDMLAYEALKENRRDIRSFFNGANSNPPFVHGETFPFGDRNAVRAMNINASTWGANATSRMMSAVDQAIANVGVIWFVCHDELASAGNERTAFEATLAYLDTKRSQIDVLTEDALLRSAA